MDKNIKKLHKVDVDILKEVVSICDKNNLKYYIIGGTLLGAVRHKGFIPWDDDIDLGIPRDDYEKFLNLAPKYLSQNLKIVNYKTDSNYQYYITRVLDMDTKVVETRIKNENKYTHASIDIFPLDGSPNNPLGRKVYYFKVMILRGLMSLCYKDSIDQDRKRSIKERMLLYIMTRIPIEKILNPNKIKNRIDRVMKSYKVRDSDSIGCLMGAYRTNEMAPKRIYGKGAFYEFEGLKLRGPEYSNDFLNIIYGTTYMQLPPVNERKTHFKIVEIKGESV